MAQTFNGRQLPEPRTAPHRPGGPTWLWASVGLALLLPSAWMVLSAVGHLLVAGVMIMASGESVDTVAGGLLLLLVGPLAGTGIAATALLSRDVRRLNRAALFALLSAGLLVGTAVEYVGWIAPAIG